MKNLLSGIAAVVGGFSVFHWAGISNEVFGPKCSDPVVLSTVIQVANPSYSPKIA
jgi:hypothetical protein